MLKVINDGIAPTKGSKYSAAIDLYANEDVVIGAGETKIVPFGVKIDLDNFYNYMAKNGYFGTCRIGDEPDFEIHCGEVFQDYIRSYYLQLEPRSSLRAKGLQAGTGIIDLDYKDEIKIILHNPTKVVYERHEDTSGYIECYDDYYIQKGDKIAQIMLKEHKTYLMGIDTEEERRGGFGSTDKDNQ